MALSVTRSIVFGSMVVLLSLQDTLAKAQELFEKKNLVAWCIVPFDLNHTDEDAKERLAANLDGLRSLTQVLAGDNLPP
jgi:hypothetical protein